MSEKVTLTLVNARGETIDAFEVRRGANIWVEIRKRGFPIGSACSGVGVCGACHVKLENTFEEIPAPHDFEQRTLDKNQHAVGERLACLNRANVSMHIRASYW